MLTVKCGFKTMKQKQADGTEVVVRKFREAVTVNLPVTLEAALDHPRFMAAAEYMVKEGGKGLIQEEERKAALVASDPDFKYDMQAAADAVTLDRIFSYMLDSKDSMSVEDITGWWTKVGGPASRQYFKGNGKDDIQTAKACANILSCCTKLHGGKWFPTDEKLKNNLIVALERTPENEVRDYLLGKLKAKEEVNQEEVADSIE